MGDAEIIPLGTHGEPGRGTGDAKPSTTARGLAGKRRPAERVPRPVSETDAADAAGETDEVDEVDEVGPAGTVGGETAEVSEGPTMSDETGRGVDPPRLTVTDREPAGSGIGAQDLLAALQSGAREVFGAEWEPQLARFLAFLRRRITGDYTVDEFGFDAELTDRLLLATLRPLARKWFRIEVRGLENIPDEGGALVVSNHSGTLPMDALMTMVSVHDRTGRHLRALGADLVFHLPVVSSIARKSGATLACADDAERMLAHGELVGVWPEGFKGIGKPYSERYKLQRFGRGGFVSAALRTRVPIVPLSVVGAEEIYPMIGNAAALARLLGIPYVPITPFFPWLGPLGMVPLPSKWLLEFGEPVRTDEYEAAEAEDPMLVFSVTDQVRETIQQTLYALLRERGQIFG